MTGASSLVRPDPTPTPPLLACWYRPAAGWRQALPKREGPASLTHPSPPAGCGGAPFNVCLTMARLDAPTAFLSNVSTDMFGAQICAELGKDNVDLSMVGRVPNPSTLAFVSFATGEPQYAFFFNDAADRSLTPATLPPLPHDAAAVHLSMGAITLEVEPVSSAFGALLDERCAELFTSFDPNIRDKMIPDASRYRSLLLDKVRHFSAPCPHRPSR